MSSSEDSAETKHAERRIAAVVLPELCVELAEMAFVPQAATEAQSPRAKLELRYAERFAKPLGVVLVDSADDGVEIPATATLHAVNESARRFGVRSGQSIVEACALVAHLVVRKITHGEVAAALGRIAELALAFGATVSIGAPDTVWVDITGAAHLWGDEHALAAELLSRVRGLGHMARVAVASGPTLARAFARFPSLSANTVEERGVRVVSTLRAAEELGELPVIALPLAEECGSWLIELGILSVGDLARLPRSAVAARLGERAGRVLELCAGRDPEPLVVYTPPPTLCEETSWDEPVAGFSPLGFVLRGLAARLSARLSGRGEAAQALVLTVLHDPISARFRGAPPSLELRFKLASPLWREDELRRVVAARLERVRLLAPTVGLRLEVSKLTSAVARQLELAQILSGTRGLAGESELPVVIAELSADIGAERVGVLGLVDSHRPELKSALVDALPEAPSRTRRAGREAKAPRLRKAVPVWGKLPNPPTRLLAEPIELCAALRVGATLAIDHALYTIEELRFEQRLEDVEWWSSAPVRRDYLRLWLQNPNGGFEALVYVERETGRRYLQAVMD